MLVLYPIFSSIGMGVFPNKNHPGYGMIPSDSSDLRTRQAWRFRIPRPRSRASTLWTTWLGSGFGASFWVEEIGNPMVLCVATKNDPWENWGLNSWFFVLIISYFSWSKLAQVSRLMSQFCAISDFRLGIVGWGILDGCYMKPQLIGGCEYSWLSHIESPWSPGVE